MRAFKTSALFWLPLRIYLGLFRPTRIKILGQEFAGEIETAGEGARLFREGDQVFGATDLRLSTNAEYVCLPETGMVALKPANITFEEAAAVPIGGPEAWHYLKGNVHAGHRVLIIGAGGSIGTFAVQLARHFGAEVTGVDSTEKLDMLRSIGADQVIDYTRDDFTQSGQTYDVIFDVPGRSSFARCERSLTQNGLYLSANPPVGAQRSRARSRNAAPVPAGRRRDTLAALGELMEAGSVKAVIDRRFPLEQTADAHRYVETGRKKGNVVITVEQKSQNRDKR